MVVWFLRRASGSTPVVWFYDGRLVLRRSSGFTTVVWFSRWSSGSGDGRLVLATVVWFWRRSSGSRPVVVCWRWSSGSGDGHLVLAMVVWFSRWSSGSRDGRLMIRQLYTDFPTRPNKC